MVATVNAVNFVDGLDGLAAGVVGIGRVAFFVFCYQLANLNGLSLATTGALLCAALAGACAGFLPHNFHPARLFMGDSGSMLIGLVLSACAHPDRPVLGHRPHPRRGRCPGQPAADAAAADAAAVDPDRAARRPRPRRRTPDPARPVAFAPDKQHLHHRLLEIGHSHRRAVLIMWLWAGLIAFGTVLVSLYPERRDLAGAGLWFAVTVALTFVVPRFRGLPRGRLTLLADRAAGGGTEPVGDVRGTLCYFSQAFEGREFLRQKRPPT